MNTQRCLFINKTLLILLVFIHSNFIYSDIVKPFVASYEYSGHKEITIKCGEKITLTPHIDNSDFSDYYYYCDPTYGWFDASFKDLEENPHALMLQANEIQRKDNNGNAIGVSTTCTVIGLTPGTHTIEYGMGCLSRYSVGGKRSNVYVRLIYYITVSATQNPKLTLTLEGDPGDRIVEGTVLKLTSNESEASIYYRRGESGNWNTGTKGTTAVQWQQGTLKAFAIMDNHPASTFVTKNATTVEPGDFHVIYPNGANIHFNYMDTQKQTCELHFVPQNINGEFKIPSMINGYTVVSIGQSALKGCGKVSSITMDETITSINNEAFMGCSDLTHINISGNVTAIGSSAFKDCISLKSIILPEGITDIQYETFRNCDNLESVTLPATLENIGKIAFSCPNLKKVVANMQNPFPLNIWAFRIVSPSTKYLTKEPQGEEWTSATLYVPKGCKEKYQSTSGWLLFKDIVEIDDDPVPEPDIDPILTGDVNGDDIVNGTDLVALVNIILGKQAETNAADVNDDGQVNGTDIVALCNIILGRASAPKRVAKKAENENQARLSISEDFVIKAGETKDMVIDLTNPDDELTLVQFDLSLPDGVSIKKTGGELAIDMCDRTTWRKHSLEANEVDGAYRFLLYSGSNTLIDGTSGGIITVTLTADDTFEGGTIVLDNTLLVTPAQKEIKPVKYEYPIGEVIPPTSETASLSIESFSIQAGETKDMVIDLTNPDDELTLVQFDLSLPDGVSIKKTGGELAIDMCDRTTWRKHSLEANEVDGAYRFLLYSGSNTLIDGTSGGIITVTLTADDTFEGGALILDNTLLVTPAQKEIKPVKYEYRIGSITGIDDILDKQKSFQIYNLNGQRVKQPQKGINVINGKKVMMK